MSRDGIAAWLLPFGAGLLALLAIHASYLVAAAHGHVPWCLPWLDSCTSISATGRQMPEKLLFKPLVTVAALLLAATMAIAPRTLAAGGGRLPRGVRVLPSTGLCAAACILAYVAALGEAGDTARLLRRTGITLGFGLVFLAEATLLAGLASLRRSASPAAPDRAWPWLCALLVVTLLLGVASVALSLAWDGYDRVEDAFEWVFALLLNGWLLVLAAHWRRQGLVLALVRR